MMCLRWNPYTRQASASPTHRNWRATRSHTSCSSCQVSGSDGSWPDCGSGTPCCGCFPARALRGPGESAAICLGREHLAQQRLLEIVAVGDIRAPPKLRDEVGQALLGSLMPGVVIHLVR